ncbi:acetyl-CoA carboxylase [Aureococcus anophagefferens]|nr:acetyl-CoA carboxylase [Aureococcus anophagefferens]
MEMYADEQSRGGILEPPGICEVKFRAADQLKAMHRLDPTLLKLSQDKDGNADAIKARRTPPRPTYMQVAHEFAGFARPLAGRMKAKGAIRATPLDAVKLAAVTRGRRAPRGARADAGC